jgi:hypothetical protein
MNTYQHPAEVTEKQIITPIQPQVNRQAHRVENSVPAKVRPPQGDQRTAQLAPTAGQAL